jgi:hypothetical protein
MNEGCAQAHVHKRQYQEIFEGKIRSENSQFLCTGILRKSCPSRTKSSAVTPLEPEVLVFLDLDCSRICCKFKALKISFAFFVRMRKFFSHVGEIVAISGLRRARRAETPHSKP